MCVLDLVAHKVYYSQFTSEFMTKKQIEKSVESLHLPRINAHHFQALWTVCNPAINKKNLHYNYICKQKIFQIRKYQKFCG